MQTIMRTATSILGLLRVSDSNHNCLLGPRSILGRGRWVCPLPAAEKDPEPERYGTLSWSISISDETKFCAFFASIS